MDIAYRIIILALPNKTVTCKFIPENFYIITSESLSDDSKSFSSWLFVELGQKRMGNPATRSGFMLYRRF